MEQQRRPRGRHVNKVAAAEVTGVRSGADASSFSVEHLNLFYGATQALCDVSIRLPSCGVTSLIGPSGCGKTSLLRALNRMSDLVRGCRVEGRITLDGRDIHRGCNVTRLRQEVGMVFQRPNPFPMSVYDNVAYGPRTRLRCRRADLDGIVEGSLRRAALWDEVKDKLRSPALGLSGGQQQRLCIARALAVRPRALLMDEPTSALDPIATTQIEQLTADLGKRYALVVVTHNMQQAARISDTAAFFLLGELVEHAPVSELFRAPVDRRTQAYLSGRFG